jgi:hypothetical protein
MDPIEVFAGDNCLKNLIDVIWPRIKAGNSSLWLLWCVWAACVFYGFLAAADELPVHLQFHDGIAMGDWDQGVYLRNLAKVHDLGTVLHWWFGGWVYSPEVPFYRPLTSVLLWLWYSVFGSQGVFGFMAATWLAHIGVNLLLIGFLRRLVGPRAALLVTSFWTLGVLEFLGLPAPWHTLTLWRSVVEIWLAMAIISAMWSWLSWMRTGRRHYYGFAIAGFLAAIWVKESGYVLVLLFAALAWHERKTRAEIWSALLPIIGLAVACIAFRFFALHGPGFRYEASNGARYTKLLSSVVMGRMLLPIYSGDWVAFGAGLSVWLGVLAIRAKRYRWYWLGAAVASLLLFPLASDALQHQDWGTGLTRFVLALAGERDTLRRDTVVATCLLGIWIYFGVRRGRTQTFAYLWLVGGYLPCLYAVVGDYAYYSCSLGWGLFAGIPLIHLAQLARQRAVSVMAPAYQAVPGEHLCPSLAAETRYGLAESCL